MVSRCGSQALAGEMLRAADGRRLRNRQSALESGVTHWPVLPEAFQHWAQRVVLPPWRSGITSLAGFAGLALSPSARRAQRCRQFADNQPQWSGGHRWSSESFAGTTQPP